MDGHDADGISGEECNAIEDGRVGKEQDMWTEKGMGKKGWGNGFWLVCAWFVGRERGRFLAAMLMLSTILSGCAAKPGQDGGALQKNEDGIKIGMTFDTFILERWIRDRDVFVSTAQKLGAVVDVQNANGDVKKQKEHIRQFIEEDVDVIVVIAVDSYGLAEEIGRAKDKGIRVMSYDRLLQGVASDLFITVDSVKVGEEMAEAILKRLPDGGEVVMICGPETDKNSTDMVQGFEACIEDSNLTVVRKTYAKAWTPEYGFQAATEALGDVPKIDAVMCGNDALAGYAIRALSERQMAGSTIVVGQDADLEACQRIVEGTQTMTVYKPIEGLAKKAAECAVQLAKGEEPVQDKESFQLTSDGLKVPYLGLDPIAVTAENMDEAIIESGFHMRDEVYLNVE